MRLLCLQLAIMWLRIQKVWIHTRFWASVIKIHTTSHFKILWITTRCLVRTSYLCTKGVIRLSLKGDWKRVRTLLTMDLLF